MSFEVERDVRTPELGIMMCTAKKNDAGNITLVKQANGRREEVPLDTFLGTVYDAVSKVDDRKAQHKS